MPPKSVLIEKEVIRWYKKMGSLQETATSFNIASTHRISRILTKYGIKKNSSRKYNCNQDFFKNINTEEKAYWLGFIFADGMVRQRPMSSGLVIKLGSKDIGHLRKFRDTIGPEYPLKFIPKKGVQGECYILNITSKRIADDLIKMGCTPRKSLTLTFPKKLKHRLYNHFIRGYFDGDGSICNFVTKNYNNTKLKKNHWVFNMIGTKKFINIIQKILIIRTSLPKVKLNRQHKMYYLQHSGKERCRLFRDYIYSNATIFLERKKDKFYKIPPKIKMVTLSHLKRYAKYRHIRSVTEWYNYWKLNKKPDEIPYHPDRAYSEWTKWADFFGGRLYKGGIWHKK